MKKPLCMVFATLMTLGLFARSYAREGGVNQVRVLRSDASGLELKISIASFEVDSQGIVSFPAAFDRHLAPRDKCIMEFHLAIPFTGDYDAKVIKRQLPTGIPAAGISEREDPPLRISNPYWLREIRGLDISFAPISKGDDELLLISELTLVLTPRQSNGDGLTRTKLNPYFIDIYKHHFLDFSYRYEDLAEFGSMAVICPITSYDTQVHRFMGLIQPWVDWKNQLGIPTTVYNVTQIGSTFEAVRDFIQGLYDNDPNLTFVQLVGDYDQVPCQVTTLSGNTGGMDAFYTLLHGDDQYPDVFVGRFSAQTAAELYTQIKRSLEYEKGLSSGSWLSRAAGVCSSNPPIPGDDDEHNWEHLDKLRAQLLDFGYTQVERVYANEGAVAQDLIDCLNYGVSLVNYCGEGYPDHWVEPEFWNADAEALVNTDMLPFIHVVSCWTGQFYNGTCLAEAFMRSRDASAEEARGAIAVYAAAPEQGVAPPMQAQDHAMELLISGTKQTIGGLCFNGSCSMIDEYGDGGEYNFLAWNLFGDASLSLRTRPAQTINAILPAELPPYYANLDIDTGEPDILVCLAKDNQSIVSGFSGPDGMAHLIIDPYPVPGERFMLTLSGVDRIPVQRVLNCYQYGAHAILDLELIPGEQFLEPETEIVKTLKITNRGEVASGNLSVRLVPDPLETHIYQNDSVHPLEPIQPGESIQTQLVYKVHRGTPDLTTVRYSIRVDQMGGSLPCSDVIHAPAIFLERVYRSPQINWTNPGDTVDFVYLIRNQGSASLRGLQALMSADNSDLIITQQDDRSLNIGPGASDSLVISTRVTNSCPINQTLSTTVSLEADNALGELWHQWKVTDSANTVESFESGNLQTFPWIYHSGEWDVSGHSLDGTKGLISQASEADSIWLAITFYSSRAGDLRFRYDLYRQQDCLDIWSLWIDDFQVAELESSNWWNIKRFPLSEGAHTLRWVGRRDPSGDLFESSFYMDLIEFPAGTLFSSARLTYEPSQLNITLAPGEIRDIPISLISLDGKDIQYSAVLKRTPSLKETSIPRLECNKSVFQPGSEELLLFSLYNSSPAMEIMELCITLPERALALRAGNFVMTGQAGMAFVGNLGSSSELAWISEPGSVADSLRTAVRLILDAGLEELALPWRLVGVDEYGTNRVYENCIRLERSDGTNECLSLISAEGMVSDRKLCEITLRANQNLLGEESRSYQLCIYYNGTQLGSIPVTLEYDSDPPGFYQTTHLTNYPNPFKAGTTFAYSVPMTGNVQVGIYNLRGQKIRTLVDQSLDKGYYRSVWDATDDHGAKVGSGIYYCRLQVSGARDAIIRCVMLK